ncbi:MAG: hypothetical protein EP338_01685 [Bacteroidetes bacterium]|nr:MAG: hypothetical protein EP338_01685 [Bacteroidota bacterium]
MPDKAVIDLGTNTFNLLIARLNGHRFEIIHSEKEAVLLGMGGIHKGLLAEESMQRGIDCLKRFKARCESHGVTEINAFGTAAIRESENAVAFLERCWEEVGIHIKIVSGLDEARMIYEGVRCSYDFSRRGLIMDIGGGSTEFIFADRNGLRSSFSYKIGVSRIYQQMALNEPLDSKDVIMLTTWLEEQTTGFELETNPELLIGASGSFETFYELIFKEEFEEKYEGVHLPMDRLLNVLDELIYSSYEERMNNEFISVIRKKMIPIAALKTKWVIDKFQLKEAMVSPCSLKEGALWFELP